MILRPIVALILGALLTQCSSIDAFKRARRGAPEIVVSVSDQRLAVIQRGRVVDTYPVSTSKFGLGDRPGSYCTPLGEHLVAYKIGGGAPPGAVFKSRRPTGEILRPNAPGRDPIVTRILWLKGCDDGNNNAFRRYIYIHGTPEERTIGRPTSYGCIRMRSRDIIELFERAEVGSRVVVTRAHLPELARSSPVSENADGAG